MGGRGGEKAGNQEEVLERELWFTLQPIEENSGNRNTKSTQWDV